jgi:hypothetical protein
VDWQRGFGQLDDYSLVNAIAQIAPFDAASKQALARIARFIGKNRPYRPADAILRAPRCFRRQGNAAIASRALKEEVGSGGGISQMHLFD